MAEKSIEFFKSISYPKFAGKYQPFEIPKGMKVKNIQETKQGLKITFCNLKKEGER